MIEVLVAASLALAMSADTTVAIEHGDQVSITNLSGQLVVRTWNRSEVRVEAGNSDARSNFLAVVVRTEDGVSIRAGRRGRDRHSTYSVRMPAWAHLEVRGNELDVEVEGLEAGLGVRSVEGDIRIHGVSGGILARTVEGVLRLEGVEGPTQLFSLDDDVWVSDAKGDLSVEAGDGNIHLERIDSGNVQASTVDGEIEFDGSIRRDGRYELTTHDGDVTLSVDEGTNASISVSTFDGEFMTEFPVVLGGLTSSRELKFTLGDGSASIVVRAFDGEVRLVRRR